MVATPNKRTVVYTAVAVSGLLLDAGVVAVGYQMGLPLGWATAMGYATALMATYLANERWSFGTHKPSWKRAMIYASVTVAVGVGRALLSTLLHAQGTSAWFAWGGAVGVSFVANYLLLFVLLEKTKEQEAQKRKTT